MAASLHAARSFVETTKHGDDDHGVTGSLHTTSDVIVALMVSFIPLALTNALELHVRIWMTFKQYRGLYFWSLNVAGWGVIVYTLAFMFKFFGIIKIDFINCAFVAIGWWCMVTGQSMVLYSRLHLILHDHRRLRWVLIMIVSNAILFHPSTSIIMFGANSALADQFSTPYIVIEKIQVTVFSIQEFIISILYILETKKILLPGTHYHFQRDSIQRTLRHLIYINILIIAMDLAIIGTEYAGLYEVQTTMKAAVYAIKLRLEFTILNQLMDMLRTKKSSNDPEHTFDRTEQNGELPLDSMHGIQRARRKAYSVYATKSRTRDTDTVASGVIHKSTEVTVQRMDAVDEFEPGVTADDPEDDPEGEPSSGTVGVATPPTAHTKRGRDGGSVSSSEIELTRAGA